MCVLVTGSTSVGATDQLRALLGESGARWIVDTVACRPGHPQLLAQLPDGRWILGLPGNPYAALTAAHTLLAPLLAGLTGRPLPTRSPELPLRHGHSSSWRQGARTVSLRYTTRWWTRSTLAAQNSTSVGVMA